MVFQYNKNEGADVNKKCVGVLPNCRSAMHTSTLFSMDVFCKSFKVCASLVSSYPTGSAANPGKLIILGWS